MAIREVTKEKLGKSKVGWTWDKKRQIWFTFEVDTFFNGERHKRRGFKSEEKAKEYLEKLDTQERLNEIGVVQIIKFPTVKELLDKHLETITRHKGKTDATRVFDIFLSLKSLPANATINQLTRKHFKDFADLRIESGLKAETASREITYLSSAIHKAGDYFAGLEKWQVPERLIYRPSFEPAVRDRVISPQEYEKLIAYLLKPQREDERSKDFLARRRTGLVVYFGLLTGLRHGEISAIEKKNFDPGKKSLKAERFKTRKSGVRLTVFEPLTDSQIWVLNEAAELYPDGKFFFSEAGKNHNKIYTILKNAAAATGVTYGRDADNGFVVHDLRHTFVTNLLQNGVDFKTAQSFSGHSADNMLMRYSHVTADSRRKVSGVIEKMSLNGTQKETLREIYEATAAGRLSYEEFEEKIRVQFLDINLSAKVANVR